MSEVAAHTRPKSDPIASCNVVTAQQQPPRGILVTGSHRSGTTWVGRMLALARRTCYLHEPFKPGWDPPYVWTRFNTWNMYLHDGNVAPYERALRRTVGMHFSWRRHFAYAPSIKQAYGATTRWARWTARRWRGYRPIVKDPIAIFSSEWLARRFDLAVVMMIRHPAAFVSSIKIKKWWFDFNHFLRQKDLMTDLLAPFDAEVRALAARNEDLVDQAILQWRIFQHVIHRYEVAHARDPRWIFVRHEDLSRDPIAGFRSLYSAAGLDFTPECAQSVQSSSEEGNVVDAAVAGMSTHHVSMNSVASLKNWQARLTADEIRRVRTDTEDLAHFWYGDEDWQ